ncbi:hypothetical protein HII13_000346 [Brettanomyces bruxellensis]|nr:hypothetical protein HII13_000346 [Brettanomyces bruxellensis]
MLKLAGPTQQLPLHICPTSKMYPNSSAAYNAPQNLALSSSSALSTERHLGDQRQHQLPQPQQAQQPQQPQQAQQQYPVLSYPPGATVRSQFATPPQVAPAALQPPAQYFQYSPAYAVGPNQQSPQFPHVSMPAQPYVYERSIPQYYSQLPVAPASPYGYQAQAAAAQLPAEVTLRAPPPAPAPARPSAQQLQPAYSMIQMRAQSQYGMAPSPPPQAASMPAFPVMRMASVPTMRGLQAQAQIQAQAQAQAQAKLRAQRRPSYEHPFVGSSYILYSSKPLPVSGARPGADAIIETSGRRSSSAWPPEDDRLLRKLKEEKKLGWREIASYFPNRTLNACQFRWRRLVIGVSGKKDKNQGVIEEVTVGNENDDVKIKSEKRRETMLSEIKEGEDEDIKDGEDMKVKKEDTLNDGKEKDIKDKKEDILNDKNEKGIKDTNEDTLNEEKERDTVKDEKSNDENIQNKSETQNEDQNREKVKSVDNETAEEILDRDIHKMDNTNENIIERKSEPSMQKESNAKSRDSSKKSRLLHSDDHSSPKQSGISHKRKLSLNKENDSFEKYQPQPKRICTSPSRSNISKLLN